MEIKDEDKEEDAEEERHRQIELALANSRGNVVLGNTA